VAAIYLLVIFIYWVLSFQCGAELSLEGIVIVLLLMPWLVVFHFLFTIFDGPGFDDPGWQMAAIASAAALNACLLYLVFYSIIRVSSFMLGLRSGKSPSPQNGP